jgi:acetyl esterase/lipase
MNESRMSDSLELPITWFQWRKKPMVCQSLDGFCLDDPGYVTYERINGGLRLGASILNSIPGLTRLFALFSRTSIVSIPSFALPSFLSNNTTVQTDPRGHWVRPSVDTIATGFIFYIHGGAYEIGNPGTHELFLRLLAYRTKTTIFAPRYVTDSGIDRMHTKLHEAYRYACGTSSDIPVLMGDSAGGGLVITFLEYLHQQTKQPYLEIARSLVLISPWVNLDFETETPYDESKEDLDFLPLSMVKRFAHRMCPSVEECAASADRILQNKSIVFPRTFVLVGGDEVLGKGTIETFTGRLDTIIRTYPGMKHVFPVLGGLFNHIAYDSISDITRFVRTDVIHVDVLLEEVFDREPGSWLTCQFDMRSCCKDLDISTYKNTKNCLHRSQAYDPEAKSYRWKHGARVYWMIDRDTWDIHRSCLNITMILGGKGTNIVKSLSLSHHLSLGSVNSTRVELSPGTQCDIIVRIHSEV